MTSGRRRWRRVAVSLVVTAVTTTGPVTAISSASAAREARIASVAGVPSDAEGTEVALIGRAIDVRGSSLFVADGLHDVVRRIDIRTGFSRVVAGNGGSASGMYGYIDSRGDGRAARRAIVASLGGIAALPGGRVVLSDLDVLRSFRVGDRIRRFAGGGIGVMPGNEALRGRFDSVAGVAAADDGTVYFVDGGGHRVWKVTPDGRFFLVAGTGEEGFSGDGGPAVKARLSYPTGIAVGPDGSVYVSDHGNYRVRRIAPRGRITTIAGNGISASVGEGVPGPLASLSWPQGLVVGPDGRSVYITDDWFVRKVGPGGRISTVAGMSKNPWTDLSAPHLMSLQGAADVAFDARGRLYIADVERVQRLGLDGTVRVIAGNGRWTSGDSGSARRAQMAHTAALAVGPDGEIHIVDHDAVRGISRDGRLRTVVALDGRGELLGLPSIASVMLNPSAIAVDRHGEVYLGGDRRVIAIDPDTGAVRVVAGTGLGGPVLDGIPAVLASLSEDIGGVAVDGSGRVYISDTWNHRVVRVDEDGILRSVAGTGVAGYSGDGGLARRARLDSPSAIAITGDGRLYIADTRNHRVRVVGQLGTIDTVAGDGSDRDYDHDGRLATNAPIVFSSGITIDGRGRLYIATVGGRVLRVGHGRVRTVAGRGIVGLSGDGGDPRRARLGDYLGLDIRRVDDRYDLVILDRINNRVRVVYDVGAL